MKPVFRNGVMLLIAIWVAIGIALVAQFQIRLRLMVSEPLTVSFSKGAWVECLTEAALSGHINRVEFDGIVVADTSGTFTIANLPHAAASGSVLCPSLGIVVVDVENREFFVPFRSLNRLQNGDGWFWSNPFSS